MARSSIGQNYPKLQPNNLTSATDHCTLCSYRFGYRKY